MENLRHQQLKIVVLAVALIATVFSLALPFLSSSTASATEGITTNYTTNTYSLPVWGAVEYDSSSLLYGCFWIQFHFEFLQGQPYFSFFIDGNDGYTIDNQYTLARQSGQHIHSQINEQDEDFNLSYVDNDGVSNSPIIPFMFMYSESLANLLLDSKPFRVDTLVISSIPYANVGADFEIYGSAVDDGICSMLQLSFSFTVTSFDSDSYSDPNLSLWLPSCSSSTVYESTFISAGLGVNEAYNAGYVAGVEHSRDFTDPNSASYTAGFNKGKNVGYNQGVSDAGNYTFFSLISSVVDVPVQALVGLLDFNLFGIDMSALYLSLFTLCIIITVVKLLL